MYAMHVASCIPSQPSRSSHTRRCMTPRSRADAPVVGGCWAAPRAVAAAGVRLVDGVAMAGLLGAARPPTRSL